MRAQIRPNYLVIFLILGVSTLIETAISYVQQAAIKLPILVVLAFLKVILVLLYFMHLKFDSRIFRYLFIAGCLLAVPLILVIVLVMPALISLPVR